MAVRFGCPIYTFDFILEAAGVVLEEGDEPQQGSSKRRVKAERADSIENMSTDSLRGLLEDVLASEDYEKAARIRDELKKRDNRS